MTLGCQEDVRFFGKKEPSVYFYICQAEHRGNYCIPLAHTLNHQSYIRLIALSLAEGILIGNIIQAHKELSIVFLCDVRDTLWSYEVIKWLFVQFRLSRLGVDAYVT